MKKFPESADVAQEAIGAGMYCAPEQTEKLLLERKDAIMQGRLYAGAVLGITGRGYSLSDPTGSDSKMRETPFAQKARNILPQSQNKEILVEAANVLLQDGGILWADGKLDWDYTTLGNQVLKRPNS